jgi:hypothetical protein
MRSSGLVRVTVMLAALLPASGGAADDARRGAELFDGRRPLVARIAGHAEPLPAEAARCSNCHRENRDARDAFAPLLTRQHLLDDVARRGGPPSRYDERAFCRALRSGIDPAWIILSRAMPRYQVDEATCAALWTHLTAEKSP